MLQAPETAALQLVLARLPPVGPQLRVGALALHSFSSCPVQLGRSVTDCLCQQLLGWTLRGCWLWQQALTGENEAL